MKRKRKEQKVIVFIMSHRLSFSLSLLLSLLSLPPSLPPIPPIHHALKTPPDKSPTNSESSQPAPA